MAQASHVHGIGDHQAVTFAPTIVLPNGALVAQAKLLVPEVADWDLRVGGLEGWWWPTCGQ